MVFKCLAEDGFSHHLAYYIAPSDLVKSWDFDKFDLSREKIHGKLKKYLQ